MIYEICKFIRGSFTVGSTGSPQESDPSFDIEHIDRKQGDHENEKDAHRKL